MREHPLVPMLRLALLCVAAAVFMPELLLAVPAFLFPACACCGAVDNCDVCVDMASSRYQAAIAGVVEVSCGDCLLNYNATFVMDFVLESGGVCSWCYSPINFCCTPGGFPVSVIQVCLVFFATPAINVSFYDIGGSPKVSWDDATMGHGSVSCDSLVLQSIPYSGTACTGCTWSAATCLVSSL